MRRRLDLVAFVRTVRDGAFGEELQSWARAGDQDTWRGWYGRTNGYEASVDLLPSQDLIVAMVSNLQSAANWQLRRRIHDLLVGRAAPAIPMPPARVTNFEPPSDLVGLYGDRNDPVEVAVHEGELYRDENQIYPVAGDRSLHSRERLHDEVPSTRQERGCNRHDLWRRQRASYCGKWQHNEIAVVRNLSSAE